MSYSILIPPLYNELDPVTSREHDIVYVPRFSIPFACELLQSLAQWERGKGPPLHTGRFERGVRENHDVIDDVSDATTTTVIVMWYVVKKVITSKFPTRYIKYI